MADIPQTFTDAGTKLHLSRLQIAGGPLAMAVLLVLTASLSLVWSHYKLLWGDEFYEMWTDTAPTIRDVIHIQMTSPVSLDPLAYHVLAHGSVSIFGANTFALRLPALLGTLLMQLSLFLYMRRMTSEWTAVVAAALTALTCVMNYSLEGRPYGLLLGLFGIAMLCWQTAARRKTARLGYLVLLALSIMLALNTHYFGLLLLGPIGVAELFRSAQRRRLDWPMLCSIAVGAAGVLGTLPFMYAAREFRAPYGSGLLTPKAILWPYVWVLSQHSVMQRALWPDQLLFGVVGCSAVLGAWGLYKVQWKRLSSWNPEMVLLVAVASLPCFGYMVAVFTSPVLEPRFILGTVIGVVGLMAIGLTSLLETERNAKKLVGFILVILCINGMIHIKLQQQTRHEILASLRLSPALKVKIMETPSKLLYVQDMVTFGLASFYEPDPDIRSHLALMYSFAQEMKWNSVDVIALTAVHLKEFKHITAVPYESVIGHAGPFLLADFSEAGHWNWSGKALATEQMPSTTLGFALGDGNLRARILDVPNPTK